MNGFDRLMVYIDEIQEKLNKIIRDIDKLDEKLTDVDRRVCRIEGAMMSRCRCATKGSNDLRKAK